MHLKARINIVLLAGGEGKRLQPLSNNYHPKQFILLPPLGISSFQLNLKRSLKITPPSNIIITTNNKYKNLVERQIIALGLKITDFQFILEEFHLNTGIVIYNTCRFMIKQGNDNLTYFLPTDQIIFVNPSFFLKLISAIDSNKINLFGQQVIEACSNFGYITKSKLLSTKYFQLLEFIEKPNLTQLNDLKDQIIYRSLGIYLAKPSILDQEFCNTANLTNNFNLPVDKLITERSKLLNFKAIEFTWHDLGSIASLYKYCGDSIFHDCTLDIKEVINFNNSNKEFRLDYYNKQLRIYKKI